MSGERKGTLLCILAAVCWGLVSNAGEYLIGIKGMNAIQVTSLRLMTAGLILLAIASIQGHKIFDVWRDRQDVINLLITGFIGLKKSPEALGALLYFTCTVRCLHAGDTW